jgi:hypothetical protein
VSGRGYRRITASGPVPHPGLTSGIAAAGLARSQAGLATSQAGLARSPAAVMSARHEAGRPSTSRAVHVLIDAAEDLLGLARPS